LEDYVLRNSAAHELRVSVLCGPALTDDDPPYREIALPRQFWKIVSVVKQDGTLSSTGYLLSQEALLDEFAASPAEFTFGAYRTYQVPVRRIAELTGLGLDTCIAADPLEAIEFSGAARELLREHDVLV
jgi:endonuclease G